MYKVFKDKDKKRGNGVIDLIYKIVDLLFKKIMEAQSAAAQVFKPVKLWDKA